MSETRNTPRVANLANLLNYQEGSVVSRILLKAKGGNITLFAFDAGEGLSEHTTPYDALVILVDGEADITIAGETFRLKAGETITMPANHPHALKAVRPFKMLLTMIRADNAGE